MRTYKILHRTYYSYTSEVVLGAHQLLLYPRESHELHIESFTLKMEPEAKVFWHRDVEGNSVATANFNQTTEKLLIESEIFIKQYNESPLDFLVESYAINYPFTYKEDNRFLLTPYMVLADVRTQELLKEWISNVWQVGEAIQSYTLLKKLCSYIYETLAYTIREEPGVQTVSETLSAGSGSCRDFALLLMEAVKCLGLASRFVSGYLYAPLMSDQVGSIHAWIEVYLPGGGWKGFDPTIGDIVGKDHIPVAVSRLAESVPPIAGSFTGMATSNLNVGVWVSLC